MKFYTLFIAVLLTATALGQDIELNGTVSAQNNQIKNVADPTDAQDAVTKNYTYSKAEVDAIIATLQSQIDNLVDDNPGSTIPSDGLLAYYPFNGNANDESGNDHHGTVNGATLSEDRNGYDNSAYNFQVADWD